MTRAVPVSRAILQKFLVSMLFPLSYRAISNNWMAKARRLVSSSTRLRQAYVGHALATVRKLVKCTEHDGLNPTGLGHSVMNSYC